MPTALIAFIVAATGWTAFSLALSLRQIAYVRRHRTRCPPISLLPMRPMPSPSRSTVARPTTPSRGSGSAAGTRCSISPCRWPGCSAASTCFTARSPAAAAVARPRRGVPARRPSPSARCCSLPLDIVRHLRAGAALRLQPHDARHLHRRPAQGLGDRARHHRAAAVRLPVGDAQLRRAVVAVDLVRPAGADGRPRRPSMSG